MSLPVSELLTCNYGDETVWQRVTRNPPFLTLGPINDACATQTSYILASDHTNSQSHPHSIVVTLLSVYIISLSGALADVLTCNMLCRASRVRPSTAWMLANKFSRHQFMTMLMCINPSLICPHFPQGVLHLVCTHYCAYPCYMCMSLFSVLFQKSLLCCTSIQRIFHVIISVDTS